MIIFVADIMREAEDYAPSKNYGKGTSDSMKEYNKKFAYPDKSAVKKKIQSFKREYLPYLDKPYMDNTLDPRDPNYEYKRRHQTERKMLSLSEDPKILERLFPKTHKLVMDYI